MKRFLALLLIVMLCLTGCTSSESNEAIIESIQEITSEDMLKSTETVESYNEDDIQSSTSSLEDSANIIQSQNLNFPTLNDENLLSYIEENVYTNIVEELDSENFFVENVEATYVSKEYLDELSYNSQENIYFGYKLSDITSQWGDTKYIFTVGNNGQTTVQAFKEYDDTYNKIIRNVAIGSGVILICATVSILTTATGTAPAVSLIFAASAKTGTIMALSSASIGGTAKAIICGIEGKSLNETIKEASLSASEDFMWGAIGGVITGGANKAILLNGATTSGLTMNEVAYIQKESKYPLDVIKGFKSMEQYNICKEAGLVPCEVNGKISLIRKIDLDFTDEMGRTNLQRMKQGLSALDPETGQSYQLHHIGQEMDSTLSILTESEHMQGGNNTIWHDLEKESTIDRNAFNKQRKAFWETMAEILTGGE
jgi:hypothetical protein